MTTIVAIFFFAFLLSLAVTPWIAALGIRLNIVDQPEARKVHDRPVPRIGGLAIYLSFFCAFLPLLFPRFVSHARLFQLLAEEPRLIAVAIGSAVAFALGLYDDNRGLGPGVKFGIQTVAAAIAYFGGIQIQVMQLPGIGLIRFGWLALPVTVFWVLLVINAINLIDGLDGLAAGVSFFVCAVLVVLCVIGQRFMVAAVLAALAGAILGFLRYNFNPAIIFMGDGGSYFLGYMLATTAILGSIKGQTAVALLIPVIALGVPLLDTAWATVRRFVVGKNLFRPDREHFHHRLLRMGYSHRTAVLMLYGASFLFGLLALVLVNLQDERAGLILVVIAVVVFFAIRRLGYLNHLRAGQLAGWVRDMGESSGISRDRRTFFNLQIQISQSRTLEEMWQNITAVVDWLEFDSAAFYLNTKYTANRSNRRKPRATGQPLNDTVAERSMTERRKVPPNVASVTLRHGPPFFEWAQNCFSSQSPDACSRNLFRLELPLLLEENRSFGTLVLVKDLQNEPVGHYTLNRVEHLRRTVVRTLHDILPPASL